MAERAVELWTFKDAVDHLTDVLDLDPHSRPRRQAIRAVVDSYRELHSQHNWRYYARRGLLNTVASYDTGTITYDHTGGTYERELTLASGTWPTWARYGQVVIDSVRYAVEDRKSGTVLTLHTHSNPGADVAAGTSYSISRAVYPLPTDFHRMGTIRQLATGYPLELVSEDVLLQHLSGNQTPQRAYVATIRNDDQYPGRMAIELAPPPNAIREYDYFYEARPQRLQVFDYSTGTVSITSGATTVTGSGTTFTSDMVGCVIRFSADGLSLPTSIAGTEIDGADVFNPFSFQSVVKEFTSATALEVEDAAPSTHTAVRYTISDHLDIEAGAMYDAFLRLSEAKCRRYLQHQRLEIQEADSAYRYALKLAIGADNRTRDIQAFGDRIAYYDLEDWAVSSG